MNVNGFSGTSDAFRQCDFCQVETTAPLMFVEIDGFNLDICPSCYEHCGTPEPIGAEEE